MFHEGLLDMTTLVTKGSHHLIIVDDLMDQVKDLASTFCIHSHHKNITVFFVNQNMFYKSPGMRTISLNSQYLIIMKLRRDLSSLKVLGNQLLPGRSRDFLNVYNECTSARFSYMVINLHPSNTYRLTLHTNILKDEVEIVYIPPAI